MPRQLLTLTLTLAALPALVLACIPGPVPPLVEDTSDDTATVTTEDGGATSATATTTATTTGDPSSTTGGTDPSAGATLEGTGTEIEDTATTTAGGPPSSCGPPCDKTWEFDGDLYVSADHPEHGDYRCLTAVHGSLSLEGDLPPEILASFANLVEATWISIQNHDTLTNVDFLGCLEVVQSTLYLRNAPLLTDLSGLSRLREVHTIDLSYLGMTTLPALAPDFAGPLYQLRLAHNPWLSDLEGAATWGTSPSMVLLSDLPALTSLAGLSELLGEGSDWFNLQLIDLPAMTSLQGLEGIHKIKSLWIQGLPLLDNLKPLSALESAGEITLNDLPALQTLDGLGALQKVFRLTLGECVDSEKAGLSALKSLAGLDSLHTLTVLLLARLDKLETLEGMTKLQTLDELAIVDSPQITEEHLEALLKGLVSPPFNPCLGTWEMCSCFLLQPW